MRNRFQFLMLALAQLATIPHPSEAGGPAKRLADLKTVALPSDPTSLIAGFDSPIAVVGETTFFLGDDGLHGRELWRSDGSEGGTRLVADLCPGRCSLRVPAGSPFLAGDRRLFFWADDGVSGLEVWSSDGTVAGTVRARDLCPGTCDGVAPTAPSVVVGERLFFERSAASNPAGSSSEAELWVSDGSRAGTRAVMTLRPGWRVLRGQSLASSLLFVVGVSGGTTELWLSDATDGGTRRLLAEACSPHDLFIHGASTRFALVTTPLDGLQCSSPGSRFRVDAAGLLEPFDSGAVLLGEGVALDANSLLVRTGLNLVRADLSTGLLGPELLPARGGSFFNSQFVVAGGRALFNVLVHPYGAEPWITDGKPLGTFPLRDIVAGRGSSMIFDGGTPSGTRLFAPFGDGFLMRAFSPDTGSELWFTDGTTVGTKRVSDLTPGPDGSQPIFGGGGGSRSLVFAGGPDPAAARRLFSTDGTSAGTVALRPPSVRIPSGDPTGLTSFGRWLVFAATSTEPGKAPWRTNATSQGTTRFGEAAIATRYGDVETFTRLGNRLTYGAGGRLWRTGTNAGRALPLSGFEAVGALHALPDRLFFFGSPSSAPNGVEPAVWLGGTAPATVLADLYPGSDCWLPPLCFPNGSQGDHAAVLGSEVYFSAHDGQAGDEPWASDGTAAGTRLLADLCPAPGAGSRPQRFVSAGARVVFWLAGDCAPVLASFDPATGEVDSLLATGEILDLVSHRGEAWFLWRPPSSSDGPIELWRTDGTGAGTRFAVALETANRSVSAARSLHSYGERLLLSAYTEATGEELWTTDGTELGTVSIELAPGPAGSSPRDFRNVGEVVLFAAADGVHGVEPWRSDGTEAGTWMVQDVAPGPTASSPDGFTSFKNRVLFAAGDAEAGRELWSMPLSALAAPPPAGLGTIEGWNHPTNPN